MTSHPSPAGSMAGEAVICAATSSALRAAASGAKWKWVGYRRAMRSLVGVDVIFRGGRAVL